LVFSQLRHDYWRACCRGSTGEGGVQAHPQCDSHIGEHRGLRDASRLAATRPSKHSGCSNTAACWWVQEHKKLSAPLQLAGVLGVRAARQWPAAHSDWGWWAPARWWRGAACMHLDELVDSHLLQDRTRVVSVSRRDGHVTPQPSLRRDRARRCRLQRAELCRQLEATRTSAEQW